MEKFSTSLALHLGLLHCRDTCAVLLRDGTDIVADVFDSYVEKIALPRKTLFVDFHFTRSTAL